MVELHNASVYLSPICPSDLVEIECNCGYFLGYAKKDALTITGKPMFKCPKCSDLFDYVVVK